VVSAAGASTEVVSAAEASTEVVSAELDSGSTGDSDAASDMDAASDFMVAIPTFTAGMGMAAVRITTAPTNAIEQHGGLLQPRYTLAELMAQCDLDQPMTDEDREWLDAPPVGREGI
jgi:hypothetical protein